MCPASSSTQEGELISHSAAAGSVFTGHAHDVQYLSGLKLLSADTVHAGTVPKLKSRVGDVHFTFIGPIELDDYNGLTSTLLRISP